MYKPLLPASNRAHATSRTKFPLSITVLIAIVLVLQFLILPQYLFRASPAALKLSEHHLAQLESGLKTCAEFHTSSKKLSKHEIASRDNPRWNPVSGQKGIVVLKNATLFDGEKFLSGPVHITLEKGIIKSLSDASIDIIAPDLHTEVIDLEGKYVTPGLVDMHSHHFLHSWPVLSTTGETNEMDLPSGPLTPFVRAIDSMKADDKATEIIASGGITTSLLIPGSANIMGGEGLLVKNLVKGGEAGEEVVEDVLFEHGVPEGERKRYIKMACGENPKMVYSHTRMGNAWIFREHMTRAKELLEKQDTWCLSAAAAKETGDAAAISGLMEKGGLPEELALETSVAMLRGKIGINVHCYEPEDIEDMLHHSKEFGFRIQAFHHALSAWKVPELIKASGENITVATFSEFGFYKKEAYDANLWGGSILAEHGVPVAFKSDHVEEETNAQYLIFQAATAHSFNLSKELALQSVTSVPAKSLEVDYRVGYARAGYDADIVVWNTHPLLAGAVPVQVYIDGKPTLDPKTVAQTTKVAWAEESLSNTPVARKMPTAEEIRTLCQPAKVLGQKLVVKGIRKSYLGKHQRSENTRDNLVLVMKDGENICLDLEENCTIASEGGLVIELENGHVLPGLVAVSPSLGLAEITTDPKATDGSLGKSASGLQIENIVHAKYGIHLDGRGFSRARLGGITRAVTAPLSETFFGGVSTGIKTSGKNSILDGGIFQDDVALHFAVGQMAKHFDTVPTVSSAIAKLEHILLDNISKDNIYGSVANGSFPLVVHVDNEYDILQLLKLKANHPGTLKLVLYGGAGAHLVAKEIAESKTPLILTQNRGAPDTFEKRNALTGPPLTRSPAAVLADAGVLFGLAIIGEGANSHIHNLVIEAGWAGRYSNLSKSQTVDLVSTNIEKMLDLDVSEDFVVWEGDPLQLGASVMLSVEGGKIGTCWPTSI
ncbi:carbohydrate esterase family 9 protein [Rutstroemia sp. NJR-2017a BBW]|nr:carbohydrate esterase family 9 protein [Rutstroemia sp. NJR-2017a BBW]